MKTKSYTHYCNKCGYLGYSTKHGGCNYFAMPCEPINSEREKDESSIWHCCMDTAITEVNNWFSQGGRYDLRYALYRIRNSSWGKWKSILSCSQEQMDEAEKAWEEYTKGNPVAGKGCFIDGFNAARKEKP